MQESILTLAQVGGDANIVHQSSQDGMLYDILERYCTGTQRAKEWNRPVGLPSEDEIGPMTTHLKVNSPTSQAKIKISGNKKAAMVEITDQIEKFEPNYVETYIALEQAETIMQSLDYDGADGFSIDNSDCLGRQLLKLRNISSQCQL